MHRLSVFGRELEISIVDLFTVVAYFKKNHYGIMYKGLLIIHAFDRFYSICVHVYRNVYMDFIFHKADT